MIKNCKYCGKQFDAKTTWQEFCKDAHRVAYFRKLEKDRQKRIHNAQPIDEPRNA